MEKNFIVLILVLLVCNIKMSAQVTYAKPEDYNSIFNRTLAVEVVGEDAKMISKLEKKKAKYPNALENYKIFVTTYNEMMKKVIEKYWRLNDKIEYKTTAEIRKLQKIKSSKYVCLYYTESKASVDYTNPMAYRSHLSVPTLNYNRADRSTTKVDYSFFLPITYKRDNSRINEGDLIFSIKFIQDHIEKIKKTGKTKYNAQKYAEDEAMKNCKELKSYIVYLNKNFIHKKTTGSAIQASYPHKMEIVDAKEINESIVQEKEDIALTVIIPTGIAQGSVGPLSVSRTTCMRLIVRAKTAKIFTVQGTNMGEFNDTNFRVKDFEKYGSCK